MIANLSNSHASADALLQSPVASPLAHNLNEHFPQLARFTSTSALHRSILYADLRSQIERVLEALAVEDFARNESHQSSISAPFIRAVAWNIERGKMFDGIARTLREHPLLRAADVLLLTETDYGMARSANRFVARDLAYGLEMNYAFAPCYLALDKGNGAEADIAGENTTALHGNALLSSYPLRHVHTINLPNGKDKLSFTEKRLGSQRAIVADIEHPRGTFRVVCLHLDAHSSQAHRRRQMRIVLDHLATLPVHLPTLIGGDWNTSGYNSRRAFYSIMGYWRRVAMGVHHVVTNHYPYPERWFERHLFRELERRGYDYRNLNVPGGCTLDYDTNDSQTRAQLADWVPEWCFQFITWALARTGGRCALKLDWFAGRGIAPYKKSSPQIVGDLRDRDGQRLSDHDAILLDFVPRALAS